MKKYEVVQVLNKEQWFYNEESKTYKQRLISKGIYNSFQEAIIHYRELKKTNKFHTYKIEEIKCA